MPSGSTRLGRSVIYGITIAPLLVTLGFYILERVPDREEYLLNLRFRTLAVIGKQIETKLESVSSGLTYGRFIGRIPQRDPSQQSQPVQFADYVRKVFPGLQPIPPKVAPAERRPAGASDDQDPVPVVNPHIGFLVSADRVRFSLSEQQNGWEDSLGGLIRPFTEDTSFDDILLATEGGDVLFQRSNAPPRVKTLSVFLKKPETKDPGILEIFHRLTSEGSGGDTDLLKKVDLDGSAYHIFAQPLTIQVPRSPDGKVKNLLLCGLVGSQKIRQEAMHVPPNYLLWIIVPLGAALLSGPFLKLVMLRRTGRLKTHDVPLLLFCSCLAMAMLTVVLLAYAEHDQNLERMSPELRDFGNAVDHELLQSFQTGRQLLRAVDTYAIGTDGKPATAKAENRVRLWSDDGLRRGVPNIDKTDFEFVFWTSDAGYQIEKWTPLETNTPFYPQKGSEHYDLAVGGQYWHDGGEPFTSELRISPTTSAPIAVLTIVSHREALAVRADRRTFDPSAPDRLKPEFISMVASPRQLLSPVIPPETGYAIVRADGSVLYHSKRERILNENLFRETEDSRELADAVANRIEKDVLASYRGNDVMFHVRPIREIDGIPWTIVVFREMEPWQTLGWQVVLDVFVLYIALWFWPVVAICGGLLWLKVTKRCSWDRCRVRALRYVWPRPDAARNYGGVARIEFGLLAGFILALAWFTTRPGPAAGVALLISAFAFPFVAVGAWIWQLRGAKPNRQHPSTSQPESTSQAESASGPQSPGGPRSTKAFRSWRRQYGAALCLGMLISSVMPVIAFFHLSIYLESEIHLRHWQRELAQRIVRQRHTAEAEIRPSRNMSPDTMNIALNLALPSSQDGRCDQEQLYNAFDSTRVRCGQAPPTLSVPPFWERVLLFVRHETPGGLDAASVMHQTAESETNASSKERVAATTIIPDVTSQIRSLSIPRRSAWWGLFASLLIAGSAWIWSAASRLFLFDFYNIRLRSLNSLPEAQTLDHPILVLGLPRSGKDSAVKRYIRGDGGNADVKQIDLQKIDLKEERLDRAWLKARLEELGIPAEASHSKVVQPAVAGAAAGVGIGVSQKLAETGAPSASLPATPRKKPEWVHITNLEAALQEKGRRDIALRLIDTLLLYRPQDRPGIIVTSVVDPMFHFDSIFPEQRNEMEKDPLPETEFGRWAHVLLQFERVLAVDDQEKPAWATSQRWGERLWEEAKHHRWLVRIASFIAEDVKAGTAAPGQQSERNAGSRRPRWLVRIASIIPHRRKPRRAGPGEQNSVDADELIEELHEKATALYKLFWSACTRPEKLMLVQLAQTGLINPLGKDTLQELIRKRLVIMCPYPRVMNESFARFLCTAATQAQIVTWEKEAGESSWPLVRNILVIMVVFALVLTGISQNHALQAISGLVTAVAGAIGGTFKITDIVAQKFRGGGAAAALPQG